VFAGTNTYDGNLAIRQGTVRFASPGAHPLVGVGVSCLNGTTATLDLAGQPATTTFLALGFDNPSAANSKNMIIDSVTGGVLTLFGGVTYTNGVAGKNNGQATISANVDLGGTNRFFAISDSDQAATEVVISGRIGNAAQNGAGLTKTGTGVLSLSGSNTYDGSTVVQEGALLLSGGGSVASSTNLSISPGALLDVAGVTGGFVLGPAQTLTGGGNIKGAVLANGTVAPEAWGAPATLNFTNNLQFGATGLAALRVGKVGGELAAGLVRVVSGDLTYGGALQVQLLPTSEPLTVGDTFTLFSASGIIGGSFSSVALPAGYTWDTNLLASGRIAVTGVTPAVPTTPTNISYVINNGTITISWPSDYIGWSLQAQTNSLTTGLGTNWTTVEGSSAVSSMSFPVDAARPSVFYRLFYQQQ
jgi:autotransporter-associated beta strand protein